METAIVIIYAFFMLFIFCYSLSLAHMVFLYLKNRKKQHKNRVPFDPEFLPNVTVQLPIYNEKFVIERLIDQVADFDYPKHKLEIQILDDSTDDTLEIVAAKVRFWQEKGIDIKQVTRPKNIGFKAGALAEGMELCKGEFIAIFDADFLPRKDFLKQTLPYFKNEKIGVVQTRWEHLNKDYSILTAMQAFGLDAHFTVEQSGKNSVGHFINFNGTAGIWRKSCIEDAGGWQSDTLTEDLDLSYRAQMKGWQFKYLEEIGSPAELPAAMNALKGQQFRWTKGAAETARKNLLNLWRTKGLGLSSKIHGTFHLLNSFLFICIFCISLLSTPMIFIKHHFPKFDWVFSLSTVLIITTLSIGTYYFVAYQKSIAKKSNWWKFFYLYPLFLAVSMGLSLHNAIAVFEGYIGKKSPFVRTPKFNLVENQGSWAEKKEYLKSSISGLTLLEILMFCYAHFSLGYGYHVKDFGLYPFHTMLAIGYGYVFFFTIKHSIPSKKA